VNVKSLYPVTAFYAECPAKQIFVNASILTKTRFLGLSVGMQTVGTLKFQLLEYGEEYVLTFPHIYVRSVALNFLRSFGPLASLSPFLIPLQVCSNHSLVGDGGCVFHHMSPKSMYR